MVAVTQEQQIHEKERGSSNAYNSAKTDLIPGLSEDVVLGEVVPRLFKLPWRKRPLLSILSHQWNKAISELFPIYHRVHNPQNILFNAFILSHTKLSHFPSGVPAYTLSGLWVYKPFNNNGSEITIGLPEHPSSQVRKYNLPKFVCDNRRVFSLTPSVVTEETKVPQNIYNVWMLDLRDFNLQWKSLPPLPKLGNYVYASSFLNRDESSYIWQRERSDSSRSEGWKLTRGKDIDITSSDCEWQWEYVNVNTGPTRTLNFDIMANKLPLYIEIERRVQLGSRNQIALFRELYRRCPIDNYVLAMFGLLNYVLIVSDGIGSSINECSLCYMRVEGSQICTAKVELSEERTRTVQEREWGEFVAFWINEMRRQGVYEMPNKWYAHSRERSAIKVFNWPEPCVIKHELKLAGNGMGEVVDENSLMTVAQKGPIYGYSYLGVRSERIL